MPSGTAVSQGISLQLIRESRSCVYVCVHMEGFSPIQSLVKDMEGRCEALILQKNERESLQAES